MLHVTCVASQVGEGSKHDSNIRSRGHHHASVGRGGGMLAGRSVATPGSALGGGTSGIIWSADMNDSKPHRHGGKTAGGGGSPVSGSDSSYSSVSFANLPSFDTLRPISLNLLSASPDIRHKAMESLAEFTPSDLLTCPHWPLLSAALTHSLSDPLPSIHHRALQLHVDFFSAAVPTAQTGEVYLSLVRHLLFVFGFVEPPKEANTTAPLVNDNDDATNDDDNIGVGDDEQATSPSSATMPSASYGHGPNYHDKLEMEQVLSFTGFPRPIATLSATDMLRRYRLLNHMQHRLPQFWLHYPDEILEPVLTYTVHLLIIQEQSIIVRRIASIPTVTTIVDNTTPVSSPSHGNAGDGISMMSLVDPICSWFIKWTLGAHVRDRLLNKIVSIGNNRLISLLYTTCVAFARDLPRLLPGAYRRHDPSAATATSSSSPPIATRPLLSSTSTPSATTFSSSSPPPKVGSVGPTSTPPLATMGTSLSNDELRLLDNVQSVAFMCCLTKFARVRARCFPVAIEGDTNGRTPDDWTLLVSHMLVGLCDLRLDVTSWSPGGATMSGGGNSGTVNLRSKCCMKLMMVITDFLNRIALHRTPVVLPIVTTARNGRTSSTTISRPSSESPSHVLAMDTRTVTLLLRPLRWALQSLPLPRLSYVLNYRGTTSTLTSWPRAKATTSAQRRIDVPLSIPPMLPTASSTLLSHTHLSSSTIVAPRSGSARASIPTSSSTSSDLGSHMAASADLIPSRSPSPRAQLQIEVQLPESRNASPAASPLVSGRKLLVRGSGSDKPSSPSPTTTASTSSLFHPSPPQSPSSSSPLSTLHSSSTITMIGINDTTSIVDRSLLVHCADIFRSMSRTHSGRALLVSMQQSSHASVASSSGSPGGVDMNVSLQGPISILVGLVAAYFATSIAHADRHNVTSTTSSLLPLPMSANDYKESKSSGGVTLSAITDDSSASSSTTTTSRNVDTSPIAVRGGWPLVRAVLLTLRWLATDNDSLIWLKRLSLPQILTAVLTDPLYRRSKVSSTSSSGAPVTVTPTDTPPMASMTTTPASLPPLTISVSDAVDVNDNHTSSVDSIREVVLDTLLELTSTSSGVCILHQCGRLRQCAARLLVRYRQAIQSPMQSMDATFGDLPVSHMMPTLSSDARPTPPFPPSPICAPSETLARGQPIYRRAATAIAHHSYGITALLRCGFITYIFDEVEDMLHDVDLTLGMALADMTNERLRPLLLLQSILTSPHIASQLGRDYIHDKREKKTTATTSKDKTKTPQHHSLWLLLSTFLHRNLIQVRFRD
jgi:hypothetical protein